MLMNRRLILTTPMVSLSLMTIPIKVNDALWVQWQDWPLNSTRPHYWTTGTMPLSHFLERMRDPDSEFRKAFSPVYVKSIFEAGDE